MKSNNAKFVLVGAPNVDSDRLIEFFNDFYGITYSRTVSSQASLGQKNTAVSGRKSKKNLIPRAHLIEILSSSKNVDSGFNASVVDDNFNSETVLRDHAIKTSFCIGPTSLLDIQPR